MKHGYILIRRAAVCLLALHSCDAPAASAAMLAPPVYRQTVADNRQPATAASAPTEWKQYLADHGLADLPALRDCFSPLLKEALLDDACLRPVFLIVLDDELCEPVSVLDPPLLEPLGGEELIRAHTVFSAGSPEKAAELASSGWRIIAGACDVYSDKSLISYLRVANGRQAYFPLADGTWLGVKGAGQFRETNKPPFFFHTVTDNDIVWVGLLRGCEMERTITSFPHIGNLPDFVQALGYRAINRVFDGEELVNSRDICPPADEPVFLSFYRYATPHRLIKISQLLAADPGLARLIAQLRTALTAFGLPAEQMPANPRELLLFIARRFGIQEAIKLNHGFFKGTIHHQDFTLDGTESDREELLPTDEYCALMRDCGFLCEEELALLQNTGIEIRGISAKIIIIRDVEAAIRRSSGNREQLIPADTGTLKGMFTAFYSLLDPSLLNALSRAEQIRGMYGEPGPLSLIYSRVTMDEEGVLDGRDPLLPSAITHPLLRMRARKRETSL